MAVARPAAGGGRWLDVAPARLDRWIDGFAERHGVATVAVTDDGLEVAAGDGTLASFHLPLGWPAVPGRDLHALVTAALAPRRFGLLLVRRGATAAAVVAGDAVVTSKVDTSYVQGRTAAGGWSQHRFARRRDNQAKAAARSGADAAAGVLLPEAAKLDGLMTGGDRHAVDAVLADPRLAGLARLRATRFLDVAEPRRAVLVAAVPAARAVRIKLTDPAPGPGSAAGSGSD